LSAQHVTCTAIELGGVAGGTAGLAISARSSRESEYDASADDVMTRQYPGTLHWQSTPAHRDEIHPVTLYQATAV
jgi:hypothetical protein